MRKVATWLAGASAMWMAMPAEGQTADSEGARLAAAFGAREHIIDASLSPDGDKVAVVSPGPQQSTVVQVLDLKTGNSKPVNYANGNPMTLHSCGWASNSRLVCTLYGVSNVEGGWDSYSRLIAMNADGTGLTPLGIMQTEQDYVAGSDGYVLDWRDGDGRVLVARNYVALKANNITVGSKAVGLGVDLVDTQTGKGEHLESPDRIVGSYIADGQGTIRIKLQYDALRMGWQDDGKRNYYYRRTGSRDWQSFSVYDEQHSTGMRPLAVDGSADVAYVAEDRDGHDALYRVALDGSMKKELAFADPNVDIDGVVTVGRRGHVVGAVFATETRQVHYFEPAYEALHAKLAKALPRLPMITIIDSSADEKKHLIYASSDVDPGQYFLFDSVAKTLSPIGAVRPELAGKHLGTMRAITFAAADGTQIPGYLTLPADGPAKGLPAIVMPHGGPASRDEWGFDWLVQFFVSRGYAVLQPNYRGSSGYGQQWFKDNGFRSWKTAIGDVNDAGRWLVAQGIADPAKLAIVGWSYGGYAALQSNVVDPDLFKAAVAIAPVTDLGMLRGQYTFSNLQQDYIGEGPQLDEGSPARHAERIKAPVLMFHGTKDVNVNYAESKAMDRALKKAGKQSELVVYPDIDHQLPDSAVRADMLARADAFLAKALGRSGG